MTHTIAKVVSNVVKAIDNKLQTGLINRGYTLARLPSSGWQMLRRRETLVAAA